MGAVPDGVVSIGRMDLRTGTTESLRVRQDGSMHVVERVLCGPYEVGLSVDWADRDYNEDPILSADIFNPDDTTPARHLDVSPSHFVCGSGEIESQHWTYDLKVDETRMRFRLSLTG